MKNVLISLSMMLCFSSIAFAQERPEDLVKKFFGEFGSQGSSVALDNLYKTNPWMSKSGSAVEQLKIKMAELTNDLVGSYHGYELIGRKQLGESFVIISYMVKYDRQPLRFTFQFYKPKDKWMVYSYQYDDNMSEEMEEAMKLTFLSFGTENIKED